MLGSGFMKKLLGIIVLGLLLSGCIVSDTQMEQTSTQTGIKIDGKIKEIILLNNHKIASKLTGILDKVKKLKDPRKN